MKFGNTACCATTRAPIVLPLLAGWLAGASAIAAAAPVPVGWRGGEHGRFDDVKAPLSWTSERGVRWKAPLPRWGNATPLVLPDRVVVTAEPNLILAVSAADGKLLWQRRVLPIDALAGDELARAKARLNEAEVTATALDERRAQIGKLRRQARRKGKGGPEAARQLEALTREVGELKVRYDETAWLRDPTELFVVGTATATPVSDGKRIFSVFGNDVVAAFELDGTLAWARWLPYRERQMHGYEQGQAASPLLVEGVLVVALGSLHGLDPATGRTVWKGAPARDFGTPALVASAGAPLVATATGTLVRPRDGSIAGTLPAVLFYASPVSAGSRLLFAGDEEDVETRPNANASATLFDLAAGPAAAPAWKATLPRAKYLASALLHGGRVYTVSDAAMMTVLDAATGKELVRRDLALPGQIFPSPVAASGRIYFSSDTGETVALEAAPPFKELARSRLESMRASPVFTGGRVYVRGFEHLYCIEDRPGR